MAVDVAQSVQGLRSRLHRDFISHDDVHNSSVGHQTAVQRLQQEEGARIAQSV